MSDIVSREIRLAFRPKGIPTAANFALAEIKLEPLPDQQVLVRNRFMSVDREVKILIRRQSVLERRNGNGVRSETLSEGNQRRDR